VPRAWRATLPGAQYFTKHQTLSSLNRPPFIADGLTARRQPAPPPSRCWYAAVVIVVTATAKTVRPGTTSCVRAGQRWPATGDTSRPATTSSARRIICSHPQTCSFLLQNPRRRQPVLMRSSSLVVPAANPPSLGRLTFFAPSHLPHQSPTQQRKSHHAFPRTPELRARILRYYHKSSGVLAPLFCNQCTTAPWREPLRQQLPAPGIGLWRASNIGRLPAVYSENPSKSSLTHGPLLHRIFMVKCGYYRLDHFRHLIRPTKSPVHCSELKSATSLPPPQKHAEKFCEKSNPEMLELERLAVELPL
jgi:hypothetical protein